MELQLVLVSIIAISVPVVSGQSFISPNINETTPVEIFTPLPDNLTVNFTQIPEDELNTPEFLRLAAKTDERIIVSMTGPFTPVVVQNGVNVNFNCLPWLLNFPGGVITWTELQLFRSPDTGLFVPTGRSEEVDRTTEAEVLNGASPIVGGEFNRWLNITRTNIIQGAQDINQGNYTCEVCTGRGVLPEPICHTAVSTLLIIGGPPIISPKGTGVTAPRSPPNIPGSFNVGDNFCFQRDSIDSFSVHCPTDLTVEPIPIRKWTKDGDLVYSEVVGQAPTFDPEFLQGRNQIFSANTNPIVLSIANTEGLLMFQTGIFLGATVMPFINFTNVMVPGFPNPTRDGVLDLLKGEWTCSVENSFGSDTATTIIRECGIVLGTCVDPSFLQNGESTPVGCVVCIPRGASITLDCTVIGDPPITYEWTDSSGVVLNNPKLTVSREDNYTCVVENPDNPMVSTTSTLIFNPSLDFDVDVIDRFGEIRRESGCERLRTQLANPPDVCVFVGETLNFTCTQSISGEHLNVTFNGDTVQGPIVITADTSATSTDYFCSLNTEGPCGQASAVISVFNFGCPIGSYLAQTSPGNTVCRPCPNNSISVFPDSHVCECLQGYHRNPLEDIHVPCTRPPSACRNLRIRQERTRANTITVRWERPLITGREDYYYDIFYSDPELPASFKKHNLNPFIKDYPLVTYSVSGLRPLTNYTIRVVSHNGVSDQDPEGEEERRCEVSEITGDIRAQPPRSVTSFCSVILWKAPTRAYGVITGYEVSFSLPGVDNGVIVSKNRDEFFHVVKAGDLPRREGDILVRVRAKTVFHNGTWSDAISLDCPGTDGGSACP